MPFFMNIVLIKTYLTEELISILLYQAILYCFHILSISHKPRQSLCAVAAMDHWIFRLKADFQLKKETILVENFHDKMITSYQRRSHQGKTKKNLKTKTKQIKRGTHSKSTEKKKRKKNKKKTEI